MRTRLRARSESVEPEFLGLPHETHIFGAAGALLVFVLVSVSLIGLHWQIKAVERAVASWVEISGSIMSIEYKKPRRRSGYWLTTYHYAYAGHDYVGDRFSFFQRGDPWDERLFRSLQTPRGTENATISEDTPAFGQPNVGDRVMIQVNPAKPSESVREVLPLSALDIANRRGWRLGMLVFSGFSLLIFVTGVARTRSRTRADGISG